jgi:DNA polymerase III subunit gamma/tau
VQDMLGLSDRGATRQLYAALLAGDSAALIDQVRAQYSLGAEPLTLIRGAMELTHAITLAKLAREADPTLSEGDKAAVQQWSLTLGHASLHRLWQLLIKGHQEVIEAPRALEACEMALLRVMHAAQMPDPAEILTLLQTGLQTGIGSAVPSDAATMTAPALVQPQSLPDSLESAASEQVDLAESKTAVPEQSEASTETEAEAETQAPAETQAEAEAVPQSPASHATDHGLSDIAAIHIALEAAGQHQIARLLHDHVRLVHLGIETLDYAQTDKLSPAFAQDLGQALRTITGKRWFVQAVEQPEAAALALSLNDQRVADTAAANAALANDPLVAAALKAFPDARILDETPQSSKNYH